MRYVPSCVPADRVTCVNSGEQDEPPYAAGQDYKSRDSRSFEPKGDERVVSGGVGATHASPLR